MSRSPGSRGGPTQRPEVVILDVNETLSDMSPLGDAFWRVGLDAGAVEAWFAGVLRDGFALTATGVNPRFADVAAEALRLRLAAAGADAVAPADGADRPSDVEAAVTEVMDTFTSLTVHPDVRDGVPALRRLGVRLVTLSNGSAGVARGLLDRAGLADDLEALLSVEDAPAWKPHPDSYAYALDRCGVSARDAMLVAVHPWDVDGAARAGLRTGWLNRTGAGYPSCFTGADVEVTGLDDLARVLG